MCNVHTEARGLALRYDIDVGTSETLRSVIDAGRAAKRLDELSTARVIGKIAEQLHSAQQKAGAGKAIGPITPAGISIEPNGAVKLGLAEPSAVAYSSPEQLTDDTGDRRSDVFSLGAVMWEALTHEALFVSPAEVKTKGIPSPSELNANIPAELGAICMKALARNPADRYQSAKVMAAEIEAVLEEAGYADNSTPNSSFELGPAMLRPDGTVLATGAIGHNSVFNSNTNTWTAAPDFPKNTANAQLDCADAPAALLPNGNVLVATSPGTFNAGTVFFEWDGTKFNKITAAPTSATADSSFLYNMVVLPTGEVFVTSSSNDVEIYEPAAAGDTTAIQPVITAVPVLESGFGFTDAELQAIRSAEAQPLDGKVTPDLLPLMNIYTGRTYTVAGTRLNGISQAASYGDDAQASTAFPLVRFTNQATGHVQYARTHDGSNYSIAKTATGSTHVDIPATIEGGLSNMQVVANGIASPALLVNVK
jgi:hypothetical protein